MTSRRFDARLREVAAAHGTPTYVYDLDGISANLGRLRNALEGVDVRYAAKANANSAVLAHLAAQGVGAEVLTVGELERAVRAGFPPAKILVSGPGQGPKLMARARDLGVDRVSLDSASQLDAWRDKGLGQARFFVRVNPSLRPDTHGHLATGEAGSKFGVPRRAALDIARVLADLDRFEGFHIHVGSQIRDLSTYADVLSEMRALVEAGPPVRTLDIGGGFAVPGFPLEVFGDMVAEFRAELGVDVMVEPGRYLVADAGFLLTSVLHVKPGGHVILDAGMADLLRPALYDAKHPIRSLEEHLDRVGDRNASAWELHGPLCENADRLGREVVLSTPKPGDLLVVEQAGAYGFAMASNYVSSFRPAEVVLETGTHRLVRRRETTEDLLSLDVVGGQAS